MLHALASAHCRELFYIRSVICNSYSCLLYPITFCTLCGFLFLECVGVSEYANVTSKYGLFVRYLFDLLEVLKASFFAAKPFMVH